MVLETLLTGLTITVLVASGIVALPWTSFELRGSVHAYRVLAALTRTSTRAITAPLRAIRAIDLTSARKSLAHTAALTTAAVSRGALRDRSMVDGPVTDRWAALGARAQQDVRPELHSLPGYL